ncbi:C1 family peptidase [Xanthomonas prunicola]|uniref:C1 family peptidase n=1 Tax=Xanthomonas prunicola TaxID=2053930 RepID=A0A9Q9J2J7_9XANT|nr:C1 family peptidase [Xanthomonas prunicola]USI99678.1 C1 family peptidase [Xanthomonas prunicola]UXA48133.1 C1 family peptidase [Xanthomonas prunicola]UXA54028.1 C1 family peptidase [Xanthomonas prunicola]UXA56597.1 C1 family peptidase [Xanthomonas prunicola]UXA64756.1 C1 family peptidase [Xanthomonas prunicola]
MTEKSATTKPTDAAASRPHSTRNYGWKPDLPDHRDLSYATPQAQSSLPPHVDLRATCSAVEDQGHLGSCTANALVGALEFLERKDGVPLTDLSRLFVYYNERALNGTVAQDSGSELRIGIKTLAHQGVCAEALWPYDISLFTKRPKPEAYTQAKHHCITAYMRLRTLGDMQACLADGYPFVFGFSVYESFESDEVAKTGVVELPEPHEKLLGGHAVLAVGYDNASQRMIVRNSWGTKWGQQGYFTMPYAYVTDRDLSDDLWTIRRGAGL